MNDVWLRTLSFLNPVDVKSCACVNRAYHQRVYSMPFVRTYWPLHGQIRANIPLDVCCQSCGVLDAAMAYHGPTCFVCVRKRWHGASARAPHAVWLSDGWWAPPDPPLQRTDFMYQSMTFS